MPVVYLPAPLRPYAGKQKSVTVAAATVGDALTALTQAHPELKKHLFGDDGTLRSFVNLYVDDRDVRSLEGLGTHLADTASLTIVPAIAGGLSWPS